MENNIVKKLTEKKIAILGFGKEGLSTYNYIRKHIPEGSITILDGNENLLQNNQDLKDDKNLEFILGSEYLNDLERFDIIIKSPGISFLGQDISKIKSKLTSQVGLLLEDTNAFVIGVTGTKGKSTTSTLIYNILKDQNIDTYLVGNGGYPILDYIDNVKDDTVLVAELSSYQLEYVTSSPNISVIINLYEEHLDHHGSVESYYNSKYNITKYQKEQDCLLYNIDNYTLRNLIEKNKSNAKKVTISMHEDAMIYKSDDNIMYQDKILYDLKKTRKLLGTHNIYDIMFALGIAYLFNLNLDKASETICNFKPLPHRLECIGSYKGITFFDDAIATIPTAAINAIKSLEKVDTLIFGGMDRGIDYQQFAALLSKTFVKNFICMPDTGIKVGKLLNPIKSDFQTIYRVDTIEDAVKLAYNITEEDKICLLSPAAPSYNSFKNFEEKGDMYTKYVKIYGEENIIK